MRPSAAAALAPAIWFHDVSHEGLRFLFGIAQEWADLKTAGVTSQNFAWPLENEWRLKETGFNFGLRARVSWTKDETGAPSHTCNVPKSLDL